MIAIYSFIYSKLSYIKTCSSNTLTVFALINIYFITVNRTYCVVLPCNRH